MESVTTCGRRKGGNKKDPSGIKRQTRLESLAKNHALHFSIYKTMLILPAKITNSTFASSGNSRTCETSITNTIQSSMRKQKIHCEYPMASASATVLWNAISTASGLQGWFADKVTIVHKLCTFQWGEEETRQATILYIQPGCCIRFRWKDEDEPGCFFEMKLTNDELTNDLMLEITDFAEPGEEDEQKELWDMQFEALRSVYGV